METQKPNPCIKGGQDSKIGAVPWHTAPAVYIWRSRRANVRFDAQNPTWASQGQVLEPKCRQENWPSLLTPGYKSSTMKTGIQHLCQSIARATGSGVSPGYNPGAVAVPQTCSCFSPGDLGGMASKVLHNPAPAQFHPSSCLPPHPPPLLPLSPSFAQSGRMPLLLCLFTLSRQR